MSDRWSVTKELTRLIVVELADPKVLVLPYQAPKGNITAEVLVHISEQTGTREQVDFEFGGDVPSQDSWTVDWRIESPGPRGRAPTESLDRVDAVADAIIAVAYGATYRQSLDGFLDDRVVTSITSIEGPSVLPTDQGAGAIMSVIVALELLHP